MIPHLVTQLQLLACVARDWCGKHLTREGRRAMRRRRLERELRAAGVPRSQATMLAARMAKGVDK